MMGHLLKDILGWLSREYIVIYRESDSRLIDATIQSNTANQPDNFSRVGGLFDGDSYAKSLECSELVH